MPIIVQKFGGSSMANLRRIRQVARRVQQRRQEGFAVVVVVSAMQGQTDRLLAAGRRLAGDCNPRELDQLVATGEQMSAALLALALCRLGVPARSLTGAQMRLRTDGKFGRARIQGLDRRAIAALLQQEEVVVATGFQGVDAHGNVTTLGRGGSDTSAVAIAAAMGAQECEIFTDVQGVFTADPRLCARARKLTSITFDEMMEMASLGAKVLQIRSVELAMNQQVDLRVRSTFDEDPGTRIVAETHFLEHISVRGISHAEHEAKLTLRGIPDQPGVSATIFLALAAAAINVDVIVQNLSDAGLTDLTFTVGRADRVQAQAIVATVAKSLGAKRVEVADDVGKVSIVGVGMMSHPGVAANMFAALHRANINIQLITTSEIKVTCVLARADIAPAVQVLHDTFALHVPRPKSAAARKKPLRAPRRSVSRTGPK